MPNFRRVFVENSYVFITVLLNNRKRTLLTDYIDQLRLAFKHAQSVVAFEIYAVSIMPEHFHVILKPDKIIDYPKIISIIKRTFTKSLPRELRQELVKEISQSKINKNESGVWHRRFYEKTIITQKELNHITDYLHYNPVKHGLVKCANDWEFSSFRKFVKDEFYDVNWCEFSEIEDFG
jgi:putative transposase